MAQRTLIFQYNVPHGFDEITYRRDLRFIASDITELYNDIDFINKTLANLTSIAITNPLPVNQIFVGSAANIATAVPMSGDATIVSSGLLTVTGLLGNAVPANAAGTLTNDGAGNLTWTPSAGGTVTNFSAGNLAPLFTTSVATSTTTPALTFALTSVGTGNFVFASPDGAPGAPAFRALVAADVPTLQYYSNVEDEGVAVTQRSTINFVGAGVTAADAGGKTVVTIPGGGAGGSLAATLAIGNTTGAFDIVVNTGQQIIGQTDLLLSESTGNCYYYASAGYIFQQWYDGLGAGNTDFLLQGGGTQLFSHLAIDIQCDTGLYGFYEGTTFSGTLDFTALTANQAYAFQDGSGTLAFLSDIVAGTTIVTDPNWTLLGETVYGTGAATGAILAGHTNADKRYLSQTGTGAISAVPSWSRIDAGDIASGILPANFGGTGVATITGIVQGNGVGAFTAITNSSTVGQVLRVTGASAYAFGALDLADTDAVTGILPVANGGTGTANGTMFTIDFSHTSQAAPADGQVIFFGQPAIGATLTAQRNQIQPPLAFTIIGVSVGIISSGASSETSTIAIAINNAVFTTLISTVNYVTNGATFNASGLSIAIAANDKIEPRVTYPTWVTTNATNVVHKLTLFCQRA